MTQNSKSSHGRDNRGLEAGAIPGMGYGRFGRMFEFQGRELSEDCLKDIAAAMIKDDSSKPIAEDEPADENPTIPAGYTYFGQFIDHDITLDTTPLNAKAVDIAALEDFRTPALDLDCIYGRGPDDQPYMYEADGLRLRLGKAISAADAKIGTHHDLLRLSVDGETLARAIIGDKRNDENRIVAQFQALFIAFHNKVVSKSASSDTLIRAAGGDPDDDGSRFRTAVNIVRWHYQWLVVHDFLGHVLAQGAVSDVLDGSGVPNLRFYTKAKANYAYIPVEFAGAAYRFGHSMVRPGYALNAEVVGPTLPSTGPGGQQVAGDGRIGIFSRNTEDPRANLNGFGVPLPDNWGIDWSFFLDGVDKPQSAINGGFKIPQPSYRIDAQLVGPLADLPEFFGASGGVLGNLAYRNLLRGVQNLRLPSGEQVAKAMGIIPLPADILWKSAGAKPFVDGALGDIGELQGDIDETVERRTAVFEKWVKDNGPLAGATPLWYYILREAEYFGYGRVSQGAADAFGGQFLGPVGSRIVAETFIGLLWNDPMSFLRRWPDFKPMAPIADSAGTFNLGRLATWVLG